MSVLETLLAAATSKAGAAVAGLTVAVGAAGATGQLPDLPSAFDNAFGGPPAEEQVVEEDPDLEESLVSETEGETAPQQVDGEVEADDQGVAREVHDALNGDEDVWPGDEGFGQAVADNAREGGSEFGQSVADAASNGRSGGGEDDGETTETTETTEADEADDGADNAETADEYRPENPPEDAGKPEDTGRPDGQPEQASSGQDTAADAPGR